MFKFSEKIDIYKKGVNTKKKFLEKFWGKKGSYSVGGIFIIKNTYEENCKINRE